MVCFTKPILTEDLYIVHEEEFSKTYAICEIHTLEKRPNILVRDKHIFSSERMLHKDYDRMGSVEKKRSIVVSLKGLRARMN
jgi:hypothetical protein